MTVVPALPDRAALLIDMDGTIVDIAPTPASVVVDPALPGVLRALRAQLDDALAVVTGRQLEVVEALLGDLPYAIAAEHGAAIRHAPRKSGGTDGVEYPSLPPLPAAWVARAEQAASAHPGVIFEHKLHGLVLHYRQVPDAGPKLGAVLLAMLEEPEGHRFTVMPAHMAFELKPRAADKGTAVMSLMARAPFAGRVPVYIGDDVTDEDGIRAAEALGGIGLRVQEHFGDAAGVRAWLARLVAAASPVPEGTPG
jgi:trehalose 6-phosphate phosphatase